MNKAATMALAFLLLAAALHAAPQATEDHSFPGLDQSQIRIHESLIATPEGELAFDIQNTNGCSVIAYAFKEKMPPANGSGGTEAIHYVDSVYTLDPTQQQQAAFPGPRGAGRYVIVPDSQPDQVRPAEVAMLSVMFADGSTSGYGRWATAMIARRQARLASLRDIVNILRSSQQNGDSTDQVLAKLGKEAEAWHERLQHAQPADWRTEMLQITPDPFFLTKAELRPETGEWAEAGAETYEAAGGALRKGISSGRGPETVTDMIATYSNAISRLEASRPAISPSQHGGPIAKGCIDPFTGRLGQ